jgi:DNA-binding NarL/FixJ family response regulator
MADVVYTIAVVAEDPLARAGLVSALRLAGAAVVASVASADQLEAETLARQAQVVVAGTAWALDAAADEVRALVDLGRPVLVLVAETGQAAAAWGAGAAGVVERDIGAQRLGAAIAATALGLRVASPGLTATGLGGPGSAAHSATEPEEPLTTREVEVLRLMVEGLANKTIARRLSITENTVKYHVNGVLAKLGAATRTEAAIKAVRLGLIPL